MKLYWLSPGEGQCESHADVRFNGIDTTGWTPLVVLSDELSALVEAAKAMKRFAPSERFTATEYLRAEQAVVEAARAFGARHD